MTTRTFKQYGIAFGVQPANITAKIDNVVVYSGPVTTVNEAFPELPDPAYDVTNELFSWTADVNMSGPQVIDINVDGASQLLVAQLSANYTSISNVAANVVNVSSGPNVYVDFSYTQFGNTYINGQLQDVNRGDLTGMWWWTVPAGGNFVENITIVAGQDDTPA